MDNRLFQTLSGPNGSGSGNGPPGDPARIQRRHAPRNSWEISASFQRPSDSVSAVSEAQPGQHHSHQQLVPSRATGINQSQAREQQYYFPPPPGSVGRVNQGTFFYSNRAVQQQYRQHTPQPTYQNSVTSSTHRISNAAQARQSQYQQSNHSSYTLGHNSSHHSNAIARRRGTQTSVNPSEYMPRYNPGSGLLVNQEPTQVALPRYNPAYYGVPMQGNYGRGPANIYNPCYHPSNDTITGARPGTNLSGHFIASQYSEPSNFHREVSISGGRHVHHSSSRTGLSSSNDPRRGRGQSSVSNYISEPQPRIEQPAPDRSYRLSKYYELTETYDEATNTFNPKRFSGLSSGTGGHILNLASLSTRAAEDRPRSLVVQQPRLQEILDEAEVQEGGQEDDKPDSETARALVESEAMLAAAYRDLEDAAFSVASASSVYEEMEEAIRAHRQLVLQQDSSTIIESVADSDSAWVDVEDLHPGRLFADKWLKLTEAERYRRYQILVDEPCSVRDSNAENPFRPGSFVEEDISNLYDMAECEPIIYKELAQFVEARAVVHCGLYNSEPSKEDIEQPDYQTRYTYKNDPVLPWDRLYTTEVKIFLPSVVGFFFTNLSAEYFFEPDSEEANQARKAYHMHLAGRLGELPVLVDWAHKTFHNLKTITFCGTMGRQKTWDPTAQRMAIDKIYKHEGDQPPNIEFLSGAELLLDPVVKEAATKEPFKKKLVAFFSKAGRFFTRRKSSAAPPKPEPEKDVVVPSFKVNIPKPEEQIGAYRLFLSHKYVLNMMAYIRDQDKVNLIVFERGFFSDFGDEETLHRYALRSVARENGRGLVSGHTLLRKLMTLTKEDCNENSFIARKDCVGTVFENKTSVEFFKFLTSQYGNMLGNEEERKTRLEEDCVRRAVEIWGVDLHEEPERKNFLRFALYENPAHSK